MKRKIIHGEGVQGMSIILGVAEMFEANQVANELQAVIENHEDCEGYTKCTFDQRKELFPEGQPKRIELSETTLTDLRNLMNKLSYCLKSTLFEEVDDVEHIDKDVEDE